jgi:hypothetical protein
MGIVAGPGPAATRVTSKKQREPAVRARLTGHQKGKKMSDFTSNFWSLYVGGITIVSILACALLLWFSGKAKAMTANDNTTGHVWDGDLREMNNPLPRWWVWLFVITIIFALAIW